MIAYGRRASNGTPIVAEEEADHRKSEESRTTVVRKWTLVTGMAESDLVIPSEVEGSLGRH